ncbi:MAG: hypothetical protein AAGC67_00515 [Myxococcota bacterium]
MSGTNCGSPPDVSWSGSGSVAWSFDAAASDIVPYAFSGRAFADPALISGIVPPDVQAFLDDQGLDGGWFAAELSFDAFTVDGDVAPESAEYRNAVVATGLHFGSLAHEDTAFCLAGSLDCSIFVEDDFPTFGVLRDQYTLRARNLRVLGVPQVSLPGGGPPVDAFDLNASFILQASETGVAPTLLDDTAIDPGLEALFGPGTHDVILTYFGSGPSGPYSIGYRVETPFFVPELDGPTGLMIGVLAMALRRRPKRRKSPSAQRR